MTAQPHSVPADSASPAGETIGELGEAGLLGRILAPHRPATAAVVGPGDDAAVLRADGDYVVTSDAMIEGPDFRLPWHSGFELGWKLAATNLSDVASMGARPTGLTVTLAAPGSLPVAYASEISRGLAAACEELAPGSGVVGGDLSRAPVLMISVTAFGDLQGREPVLRSGARAGQTVAYAGELGLAGAGLALLFEHCSVDGVATAAGLRELRAAHPREIAAQLAPSPPIGLGVAAAEGGATAMMDVSDSLSLDGARMAAASGVTLDLDSAALGASPEGALTGGEDHGLLAVFPAGAALPAGFRRIGSVRPAGEHPLLVDGAAFAPRGWDPYRAVLPGSAARPLAGD